MTENPETPEPKQKCLNPKIIICLSSFILLLGAGVYYSYTRGIVDELFPWEVPEKAEQVSWAYHSGEKGGGFDRLTIWADGRSEFMGFAPFTKSSKRPGWTITKYKRGIGYTKKNILPKEEAISLFQKMFKAGILQLKEFKLKEKVADLGHVKVVIFINGISTSKMLPEINQRDKITRNRAIYFRVKKLLSPIFGQNR